MTVFQAIVLGIIQGITEFLPISSSGHLILIPYFLGWEIQDLSFDVVLHFGSALAIVTLFIRDWLDMFNSLKLDILEGKFLNYRNFRHSNTLRRPSVRLLRIFVVSIPVGIIALLFGSIIEEFFRSPLSVSFMLVLISAVMGISEIFARKHNSLKNGLISDSVDLDVNSKSALFISLSQIFALIPGTSRSGITISTGLFSGLTRETAAQFSFLLGTPLIIGATIAQIPNILSVDRYEYLPLFVGFLTSFAVGVLSLKFLLNYLKSNSLSVFIFYRLIIALLVFYTVL